MATLLVFPLRFFRSMGHGGIVASTVAMLAALIVLPTVLRLLGPRVDALALPRWRDPKRWVEPARHWCGLGRLSTQRAVPVATLVLEDRFRRVRCREARFRHHRPRRRPRSARSEWRGARAAGSPGSAISVPKALAALGLEPPEAVMTDRAFVYTRSVPFRALLAAVGARHIVTPPYTPRWNGKVEAFINTLLQEWAYVREWPSSGERARALSSFVHYYNRRRPHSSLGADPPISRVHNVRGQLI